MKNKSAFCAGYGEWAIVAGASEGLGAEYAKQLASRGLNLILIARRAELLQTLATKLSDQYHVEIRTIALDLSLPDTAGQIFETADGLEIGLLVYNAAFFRCWSISPKIAGRSFERDRYKRPRAIEINLSFWGMHGAAWARRNHFDGFAQCISRFGLYIYLCSDEGLQHSAG